MNDGMTINDSTIINDSTTINDSKIITVFRNIMFGRLNARRECLLYNLRCKLFSDRCIKGGDALCAQLKRHACVTLQDVNGPVKTFA